jgi:hypothetical protein
MPAPSPWVICWPRPDGQQDCQDIPVLLWPPDIDEPDPVIQEILDQIGRLQALAGEVTEPELRMQLTEALDGAVDRVGAGLPAGFEFRRAARHDLPNEGFGDPLPDVRGLFYIEGWNTLHDLGYDVIQKTFVTGAEDLDGIIGDQEPAGGTPDVPPGPVTIWVAKVFPQPPHLPDPPVIE